MTDFEFYEKIMTAIVKDTFFINDCIMLSHQKEYLLATMDKNDTISDEVYNRANERASASLPPKNHLSFLTYEKTVDIISGLVVKIMFGSEKYGSKIAMGRFTCELTDIDTMHISYGDDMQITLDVTRDED